MFAQIIGSIIVVILRKAEIWHTDALPISPLASRQTLFLRTSLRGVRPKRSPLLLVAVRWESFVFIVYQSSNIVTI